MVWKISCAAQTYTLLLMKAEFYLPDEYPNEPRLRDLPRTPGNWARIVLLTLIRLYQKTISPQHPPGFTRRAHIMDTKPSINMAC